MTSRWNVRSYNYGLTGFEIFKFALLLLVVLGVQAVLIWYQSTLLSIHVSVSNNNNDSKDRAATHRDSQAPDPDWRDFPFKCAENAQNLTILNCVSCNRRKYFLINNNKYRSYELALAFQIRSPTRV